MLIYLLVFTRRTGLAQQSITASFKKKLNCQLTRDTTVTRTVPSLSTIIIREVQNQVVSSSSRMHDHDDQL